MSDGQVVYEIVGDASNVNKTVKQVTSNIQSESKKWDQAVDDSMDKAGESFLNWKTVAAGAITAIGAAVIKFGQEAIEAASDLSEVQNVVDTVFGDGARVIDNWSQKAGEKFGLTETQAKRFTSTLGAMMKSSGLAGNEIVNMSTDLAGLAADMASFYNLDFETAFEKIRSGISGETMPLKQLGINMSVANLEAFALAQGLKKTFSEMDQGEQTMLRYQYLMQATSDAQGDFAKTADGFANAQRRIESSMDSIKTSVGKILLPAVEDAVAGIADFLSHIASGMMPEKTIFDEFNEAEIDTQTKLSEIQATYDSAKDLIKILKDIEQETVTLGDGTTISLDKLFGDLGKIEKNGGDVRGYIESLGLDVDYVVEKYNEWKEATRQLTSLVPSLTNQIDAETGAIKGGTDALSKNLEEWKKNEENKVYWAEYYAKAEAVARAKGEQAGIQITARARQLAAEREAKKLAEQYGTTFSDGRIWDRFTGEAKVKYESGEFNNADVDAAFENYNRLVNEADAAQKKAEQSANDLADAEALLADELKATEEITGETLESQKKKAQEAGDATKYAGKSAEEWKKALEGAPKAAEAIKAVTDYFKGVRDATEQAVNSTVKGFEKITTEYDALLQKQGELRKENGDAEMKYFSEVASLRKKFGESWMENLQKLGEESKEWKELSDKEKEAYNALVKLKNEQEEVNDELERYSPKGMMESLESQKKFMQDYLDNLKKAREYGLSDELIASLSDGSTESASMLAGLVAGGKDAAKEVDALYQEVQSQKKGFVDSLTEQKLAADETFKGLVKTAQEAMDGLDMGDAAFKAMGSTVTGIAAGIRDHVPEVQQAVNELISALSPLTALGFSYGFNTGWFQLKLNGEHETGLDYVPFDGYLAGLHEGEGILTAEENQIWQRFKNGDASGRNVDYETLGNVMRDNVHAGGNVYLDGRTVGQVVSGIQGQSYRNLQRSGWQG